MESFITKSALEIASIAPLIILSSRGSSYKTTSGLTIPPHLVHFGIPFDSRINF